MMSGIAVPWLDTDRRLPRQVVTPVIIMFPKASALYSINTRRVMTEAGIQLWLEALVASRCAGLCEQVGWQV